MYGCMCTILIQNQTTCLITLLKRFWKWCQQEGVIWDFTDHYKFINWD